MVLWLQDVEALNPSRVGGKGANLALALKHGFPVPAGFCVEPGDDPADLLTEWNNLTSNGMFLVAVRSSATGEDSERASFAGQLESYLGIDSFDRFIDAVQGCRGSSGSARAQAYGDAGQVAVVVQTMVNADSAGVAFSVNPATGNEHEFVVNASWGVGEAVVGDLVTPDEFILCAKTGVVLKETLGIKGVRVDVEGQEHTVDDPTLQNKPSLETGQLKLLHELLVKLRAELQLDHHVDVEWAFEQGQLFLLQHRPVTTLVDYCPGSQGVVRDDDWVTTCNAGEMFPGVGTPLTISLFGNAVEQAMQGLQIEYGVRAAPDVDHRILSWHRGHLLLNMSNLLNPLASGLLGVGALAKQNGEMSILGKQNPQMPVPPPRGRWWTRLANLGFYTLATMSASTRLVNMKRRVREAKRDLSRAGQDATSLYSRVQAHQDAYRRQWQDGIVCGSTSATYSAVLLKILGWVHGTSCWAVEMVARASALLRTPVASGGPLHLARQLKRTLDPKVLATINAAPTHAQATELLLAQPKFQLFLAMHGHRCIKESEFRVKDWYEHPEVLVAMIRDELKSADDAADPPEAPAAVSWWLKPFVWLAHRGVQQRELAKSLQVQLHSEIRRALRLLAQDLHLTDRLPDPDLMYFVTDGELCDLVCGDEPQPLLIARARRRRHMYDMFVDTTYPELAQGPPRPESPKEFDDALNQLVGTPVSVGTVTAPCRIVRTPLDGERLRPGEIMVCPFTDVGWTPLFSRIAGLVTERGGMLSHGAVVAREFGIPCVVGVPHSCSILRTGDVVTLHGSRGQLVRTVPKNQ